MGSYILQDKSLFDNNRANGSKVNEQTTLGLQTDRLWMTNRCKTVSFSNGSIKRKQIHACSYIFCFVKVYKYLKSFHKNANRVY